MSSQTNGYTKEISEDSRRIEPDEIVLFRGAKKEANTYPKYESITIHTGRKTFCTLSLKKGMSAEEVMEIGHKDYQSFKRYVKLTEAKDKNSYEEGLERDQSQPTKMKINLQ